MKSSVSPNIDQQMAQDVRWGLGQHPRQLLSQYFYDDAGSELFRDIMRMESYYLTDCEYEIFDQQAAGITKVFTQPGTPFRLIELGAGDGLKTKLLLRHLLQTDRQFTYLPIDISEGAIDNLSADLLAELPDLDFQAVVGEYFDALHRINESHGQGHKVILFVGGNIGNFSQPAAITFLQAVAREMDPKDQLLIGFDLKKDPRTILRAYDDEGGITRAFNLNILSRLNRELGANFQIDQWQHYASYDPVSGETKSYLVSEAAQDVHFSVLKETFHFGAWEPIWTELSQKYDLAMIESLAQAAGFQVIHNFIDERGFLMDSVWSLRT
jgi:dimethylhistidine N-methyltransferase